MNVVTSLDLDFKSDLAIKKKLTHGRYFTLACILSSLDTTVACTRSRSGLFRSLNTRSLNPHHDIIKYVIKQIIPVEGNFILWVVVDGTEPEATAAAGQLHSALIFHSWVAGSTAVAHHLNPVPSTSVHSSYVTPS